jgi:hypothetical protein
MIHIKRVQQSVLISEAHSVTASELKLTACQCHGRTTNDSEGTSTFRYQQVDNNPGNVNVN